MAEGLPTAHSSPSKASLKARSMGVAMTMSPTQLGRYTIVFPITPHTHETVVAHAPVAPVSLCHARIGCLDLICDPAFLAAPRLIVEGLYLSDDPLIFRDARVGVDEGTEGILGLGNEQVHIVP